MRNSVHNSFAKYASNHDVSQQILGQAVLILQRFQAIGDEEVGEGFVDIKPSKYV